MVYLVLRKVLVPGNVDISRHLALVLSVSHLMSENIDR